MKSQNRCKAEESGETEEEKLRKYKGEEYKER